MALLTVHNLNKNFGERVLFDGVGFEVGDRDKIGLVGDNGCGKTTLFRILTGEYSPDRGGLAFSRDVRVGYMEQHAGVDEKCTLYEQTEKVFVPVIKMEHELEDINARLQGSETGDTTLIERQHILTERIAFAGGLTYKSRIRATLLGLGFDEAAFTQPMSSLSGGQRSKAAMSRLLLSDTNLLLLDEPTNHLDIQSVEWLEGYLQAFTGAVMIISHDRYFLDRVTEKTMEIANGKFYFSNGNYSTHKALRDEQRKADEKHFKVAVREINRVEDSITKLKQFNREKSIRAAESKEKMLERIKGRLVTPESNSPEINFNFSVRVTGGNEVVNAERLSMSFAERRLFNDVSFSVRRGERVFLLGPNGCGKTTLLKIMNGQLNPISGGVRLGAKISVGYYDQTQSIPDTAKTVIDEVWDAYPERSQTELRNALAAFLFRSDHVFKPIYQLSGGERARLLLLKLMMARDNLLLLDEPTNHLDIASREALEEALTGYNGTTFIVSHDRYLINRCASRVLYLTPNGCLSFEGNYDVFIEEMQKQKSDLLEPNSEQIKSSKENSYKQRLQQDSARRRLKTKISRNEDEIAEVEAVINELNMQLCSDEVSTDYSKIMKLTEQLEQKNAKLERLMEEWEQLQSKIMQY